MGEDIRKLIDQVQDGSDDKGRNDCGMNNAPFRSIRNAFPDQIFSHRPFPGIRTPRMRRTGFFFEAYLCSISDGGFKIHFSGRLFQAIIIFRKRRGE